MSGRHRHLVAPRNVNRRLLGAGAAGLAAVLAGAPLASADPVAPTSSDAPLDVTATDAPSSDAPSSDAPSSAAPSSAAPSSDAPSSAAPSSEAPSPGTGSSSSKPTTGKQVKPKADVVVTPNYGAQKIRVGVQIKDGSWVPPGTSTAHTRIRIVETGPNAPKGGFKTTCHTQPGTAAPTDDPSATFCRFENTPATVSAKSRLVTPDVVVKPGPIILDPFAYYLVLPGDKVRVLQGTVEPNLVRDTEIGRVAPCVAPDASQFCPGATDVIFQDPGLPPLAVDDSATTLVNQPVDIDVLSNDETKGAPDAIDSATDPAHGTAKVTATGITYTPDAGFLGVDTFDYTMSTPNGASTATVTVTVTAPPPTAVDDTASTVSGQAVKVHVRANDSANGGGVLHLVDVGNPSHGTAVIEGGHVVYTPAADFVGTDTFPYTVSTPYGSASANVTVTVTAPVAPAGNGSGGLANTGSPVGQLVDLAAALLLAGGGVTVVGRHRRARGRHV